jgi:hypothetical protein
MSVSWVPPPRTSPYQNGVAPGTKSESLKAGLRQAVGSGKDASFVPLRQRQAEDASTSMIDAAGADDRVASNKHTHPILLNFIFVI